MLTWKKRIHPHQNAFFLINLYNQMDLSTLDISLFCKLSQLFIYVKFDLSTRKVQPKTHDFKYCANVI